jgi:hypothetical protein
MEKLTQMVQKMVPLAMMFGGGVAMGALATQTSPVGAIIAVGLIGIGMFLNHKNKAQ